MSSAVCERGFSAMNAQQSPTRNRLLMKNIDGILFVSRKNPISENNSFTTPFLLCSCFRTHSTNTTSQNIGGTDAWAVTPSQLLGGPSPSPPRSPPVNLSH